MSELVKIRARPKLNLPNMLATWPGICNVSIIIATYLRHKLNFRELGKIEPSHFFDPIGVSVKDSLVEAPHFPESRFYYWKNTGKGSDLILFVGDDQPSAKAYELANCVLDVAQRFQVKRVYTCAAAATRIHHTEPPRVWGVATNQRLAHDLEAYDLAQKGEVHISGLNGLLLGVAKERGIDGVCLLGEVPMYVTQIQNPMAALAILKVLAKMLDVEINMSELAQLAGEAGERMKQVAAEAMGEYIDHFTEPIWEREGGGDNGEGDEDEYEDED